MSDERPDGGTMSLAPIFLLVFLDLLGIGIALPVLTPMLVDSDLLLPPGTSLAARAFLLGLMITLYPLAQFFGAPMLGALSDRHGRKRLLMLSLVGTAIGYVLFGYGIGTGMLALLFLGRIIDGFTGGNISIAMSSIADLSDERSKVRNFGLIGMAFGFGFIIGPYLGGKLSDPSILPWFDFATPFWFAAILSIANLVLLQICFKETLRTRVDKPVSALTGIRNVVKAFSLPSLRTMFIVVFILTFGFTLYTQFFQVYLLERFGFHQSEIGDTFAYLGIWVAVAQGFITRPVSKRFPPRTVLRYSLIALAIAIPLVLLVPDPIWLLLTIPLIAVSQGLTQPNYTAIISNLSGAESQGEILGINQSIVSLAMAIPPLLAGLAASIYVGLPVLLSGVFIAIAWLIFILFYRPGGESFHEV